jgi:N-hydroxyarylamine O-acetyltransferase
MPALAEYLRRIGHTGPVKPDLAALSAIHRAHLEAIPFENLDVQLGHPRGMALDVVFEKIVRGGRGGWCYEMNGLMGWALGEIGFDVLRMAGGVMRQTMGDKQIGNHLCLLVTLDRPYLVDVGFGSSLVSPLPLEPTERLDTPFTVRLSEAGDGFWRYEEQELGGAAFSYDFRVALADNAQLDERRRFLETDPASPFVQNLVVKRREGARQLTLRGRVLAVSHAGGIDKTVLASAEDLVSTLRERFHLDVPEAASLWPAICTRHEALFPQGA